MGKAQEPVLYNYLAFTYIHVYACSVNRLFDDIRKVVGFVIITISGIYLLHALYTKIRYRNVSLASLRFRESVPGIGIAKLEGSE